MTAQRKIGRLWAALAVLASWLCSPAARGVATPPSVGVIADDLDSGSLRVAIEQSLAFLEKLPPERVVGEEPRRFTAGELIATLRAFRETLRLRHCRRCWIQEVGDRFEFISSSSDPELQQVLFTGYFQPVIPGSLVPTGEYPFPIYGKPADLIAVEERAAGSPSVAARRIGRLEAGNLVPYYTRAEIDQGGALRGRGYEIAWLKDPVDIFFLQIQGSGILQLPDGSRAQVGYAAQNGRAYRSIGRLLIDEGKVPREEMSMQRLRRYLFEHPLERDAILAHNESYVFFRFLRDGPLGNLEVPVTAGRSIATDLRRFPRGALGFIYSERPVLGGNGELLGWTPFLRFVLNQDTGGAIRGPQRVDLYFGTGVRPGEEAGYMNSRGKLYFLALKKPSKTSDR